MKRSRFTEEQKLKILKEADLSSEAVAAKQHGLSRQTIYKWRQNFSGMDLSDVRRLKTLEQENGRLKKLLAERDLEVEVMKEIVSKKW